MDVEVKALANKYSQTEAWIDELNGKLGAKAEELNTI